MDGLLFAFQNRKRSHNWQLNRQKQRKWIHIQQLCGLDSCLQLSTSWLDVTYSWSPLPAVCQMCPQPVAFWKYLHLYVYMVKCYLTEVQSQKKPKTQLILIYNCISVTVEMRKWDSRMRNMPNGICLIRLLKGLMYLKNVILLTWGGFSGVCLSSIS